MTAIPAGPAGTTRTRLLAIAALLLTLIAGIAIGWGVGHRPRGGPPHAMGRPGAPGRDAPSPSRMMARHLNLTAAQQQAIDTIFATRRMQIGAFWDGPGARLRQIVDSTTVDIRAVLDSTQRLAFDKMQQRQGRRPDGFMGGPGRPGHGGGREHGERDDGPPPDGGPPPPPPPRS